MTDLTEKWRKGELPSGWYYVRLIRGEYRIDLYINGKNEWIDCPDNIIDTIVCEVPSYEEWQAKIEENAQLKEQINKCCLDAINRGTANTVKAVKEFGMPERIKELVEQNAQLKELLKECVKMNTRLENALWQWNEESELYDENEALENKINEVLK